jgi:hypothetical protein
MCERWKTEPDKYPKYPRLPVERCAGYERKPPSASP